MEVTSAILNAIRKKGMNASAPNSYEEMGYPLYLVAQEDHAGVVGELSSRVAENVF